MTRKPRRLAAARTLASDPTNFQRGRNRKAQLTTRGWNRFGKEKRALFLQWFAATCNAKLSAREAEVGYSTIYETRMNDPAFAEAWDRALEQGYARLEEKLLDMQFEQASGAAKPVKVDGSFEPPETKLCSPDMAFQLLKQHRAEVVRLRAERGETLGDTRAVGDAEVRAALVKSMKALGLRVAKEDLKGDED